MCIFTINIYASRNINAFDFLFAISLIKCAKPKTRIYAITDCKCVWLIVVVAVVFVVEWIGGLFGKRASSAADAAATAAASVPASIPLHRVRETGRKRNEHLINI